MFCFLIFSFLFSFFIFSVFSFSLFYFFCWSSFVYFVTCFENIFLTTLNMHAPLKTKYLRANNSPFMTKELLKAIMVRCKLRNKSLKLKTLEAREQYKKQRNFCVSLLRSTKTNFYESLDPKLITDNKKFWKQVKPFFSDKSNKNTNIILQKMKRLSQNQINVQKYLTIIL